MPKKNPKRQPVEVVAIIPARGGQQSIPYKNLQKLGRRTLLQWAINVAFEAKTVDAVIVSTEDERIAGEAKKAGALVAPRPAEYSQPTSGDAGFYHHTATWLESEFGWKPEYFINLRPTGPLRFAKDVDAMVEYMKQSGADGVKSVIPAPLHPYKMWQFADQENKDIGTAGKLMPVFDNDYRHTHGPDQPRQKIQQMFPVFFQDAQIDITRRKFVLDPKSLANDNVWGPNMHGYVLDPRTIVDIDTPADLRLAAKIYRMLLGERKR